ncbi:2-hydroxymuconate tautomerase family protein [Thalassobacillus devorans]|uniref:2-hydroxymuconate tautomerase family protein n=1 Tax=Thalassobacillus devorans TaxID=279813 RepID=UPI00048E64AD|nr:2-hydroxymuconate tautomerase family protein [Thalassobacillus devorans]
MPIAFLHILKGRKEGTKKQLIKEVNEAIVRNLNVDSEKVRIILQEVEKENWAVAGLTKADSEN